MIWTPTSELMVIATAAFCISFGVIYTLIACYKWKRKHQSEEHEKLRDELLRQKFLSRRKSTSLTSPPSTVMNPNYSGAAGGSGLGSPYKTPTRHLRSTSASYSPTHYLSPHHRRMSTPTHPTSYVKTGVCCKTNCDHHALPAHTVKHQQLSPRNHVHLHHGHEEQGNKITTGGGNTDSPSRSVLIIVAEDDRFEKRMTSTPSPLHTIKENPRSFLLASSSPIRSSPSHKSKPIPSKLNTSWNQKSFSFGPIPPPRRDRVGYGLNSNYVENNKDSAFSLSGYIYEEEDSNGNEESERRPLLPNKNSTQKISNQKTDNYSIHHRKNGNYQENDNDYESSKLNREKFAMDSKTTEERDSNNWRNYRTQPRNATAHGYPSSPKLFSKEQIVLEEIPYYIEEQDCN